MFTDEQLKALERITFAISVAVVNPTLLENMRRIEWITAGFEVFGIVSKEQTNRLFEKIGYTQDLPEHWTLDDYSHECAILERFREAVMEGREVDQLIDAVQPFEKTLVWRNGRPWLGVKDSSE